ncbi:MAG: hypothetical protein ABTQ25_10285 [Nitrosomonas ureae]
MSSRTKTTDGGTMTYTMSWENRGVYKHFTGHVSYPEYSRSQEMVLADHRTDSIRYVINDFLEVQSYSVTSDQAEYLAAFNRGASISNPRLRIAYVTTDAKIKMLIKLVSIISSFELITFSTLAAAREWSSSLK